MIPNMEGYQGGEWTWYGESSMWALKEGGTESLGIGIGWSSDGLFDVLWSFGDSWISEGNSDLLDLEGVQGYLTGTYGVNNFPVNLKSVWDNYANTREIKKKMWE